MGRVVKIGWKLLLRLSAAFFFSGQVNIAFADELVLTWQSRNRSADTLTQEFGELYQALNRLDGLGVSFPTQSISENTERSLRQILIDAKQFDGRYLPVSVDQMVCKLNPTICKVGDGTVPRWRNQPKDPILIPAFQSFTVFTNEPYLVPPNASLKAIVINDRRGCTEFDESCLQVLHNLNRDKGDLVSGPLSGTITVPTLGFVAEIRLSNVGLGARSSPWNFGDVLAMSEGSDSTKPAASRLLAALEPIRKNLIYVSSFAAHQANGGAVGLGRENLFKYVNYLPPKTPPAGVNLPFALLDMYGPIDQGHCAFRKGQISAWNINDAGELEPAGTSTLEGQTRKKCGTRSSPKQTAHPTHIAGIVAAQNTFAGGAGLYPKANVFFYKMSSSAATDSTLIALLANGMIAAMNRDIPRVLNLSLGYQASNYDPLTKNVFEDIYVSQNTLIVASAGNDGAMFNRSDNSCGIRPACLSAESRNIISVIAVEGEPPRPATFGEGRASNFGDRFDIAAPGKEILSCDVLDQDGMMSGTSQAAPVVSGAALLALSKRPGLNPGALKNILIYSSDLFVSLDEKSFGGLLDVDRSLAVTNKQDIVRLTSGADVHGKIVDLAKGSFKGTDLGGNATRTFDWRTVRRLHRREDGLWDVFELGDAADEASPMARRKVKIDTVNDGPATTAEFEVVAPGSTGITQVKFQDVRDIYVGAKG